jgi:uncharacterized protein (DUF2252 family)
VQLCGDAHLSNFGAFGSPERRLVFDVNDFDETLPGPFEWDVKRLVASMSVAGRESGFSAKQRRAVAVSTGAAYREAMRAFTRRSRSWPPAMSRSRPPTGRVRACARASVQPHSRP